MNIIVLFWPEIIEKLQSFQFSWFNQFQQDSINDNHTIILKGLSVNFYIMKKLPPEIDTLAIVSINLPDPLVLLEGPSPPDMRQHLKFFFL